jgi:hypothetical protein
MAVTCAKLLRGIAACGLLLSCACRGERAGVEIAGRVPMIHFAFRDCATGKVVKASGITVIDDRELRSKLRTQSASCDRPWVLRCIRPRGPTGSLLQA